MANRIPAVELIYRQMISQPSPSQPKPARVTATKKVITRADVDDILQRKRPTSPEELQEVLNTKALALSESERDQISTDVTIVTAQRARQVYGRRDDPSAEFIAKVLGYAETPHGLVDREWIAGILREGAQKIARCKRHQPPRCGCWSSEREILWQARAAGEKTPQSWAAAKIYAFLEALELASGAGTQS